MFFIFIKGFLIGLAVAAPVGPIGMLCIHRSLYSGFKVGLMTGLGAALADGIYGIIAGFGLTVITTFLIGHKSMIQGIGGVFLICLGARIVLTGSDDQKFEEDNKKTSLYAMLTTFFLTLSNPMTILSFIAIFAGLGLGTIHTNYLSSLLLVLGVILGSTFWWIGLTTLTAKILKQKLSSAILNSIKVTSGAVIVIFGIISMAYSTHII